MLTAIHLRLQIPNGVSEEYRVRDGHIEVRQLQDDPTQDDLHWLRLTPEQVADHVNRNTVVAQWLTRRIGWRRLLRACIREESIRYLDMVNSEDRRAA